MALRRLLSDKDLEYLANLCHNCRSCFYACQYAPPHEFVLNVPKSLSELRVETYGEQAYPRLMSNVFRYSSLTAVAATMLSLAFFLLTALLTQGKSSLIAIHTGANSFYEVLPYPSIVYPMSAAGIAILLLAVISGRQFWQRIGFPGRRMPVLVRGMPKAVRDVLALTYLDGSGRGCNYPDERFRQVRKLCHHALFYGFLTCLASTAAAAFYHHVWNLPPPYSLYSIPVLSGVAGGVLMTIGCIGCLLLKLRMDRDPLGSGALSLDTSFLLLLLLSSITGLLLLLLRETAAMGSLLILHLAFVGGLFLTLPFGKFMHGIYRSIALVKHAIEQSEA